MIWKNIDGYVGLYQVSNTGLVKSLERKTICGRNLLKERILKNAVDSKGYYMCMLYKNKITKTLRAWLFWFNFIILQWFCIRLARCGKFQGNKFITESWTIIGLLVPLTGWWSDYVYIKKVW